MVRDQLVPPDGGVLLLHFIRLEQTPQQECPCRISLGRSSPRGVPAESVYLPLADLGLDAAVLASTEELSFTVRERLTFR